MTTELKPCYAILFEDADRRPEIFTRREDAAARYNALRGNWNCHLFVRSSPPPSPEQDDHTAAMAFVQAHPTNEPWKAELELATMLADRRASPPTPGDRERAEKCAQGFAAWMNRCTYQMDEVHEAAELARGLEAEFAAVREAATKAERERCWVSLKRVDDNQTAGLSETALARIAEAFKITPEMLSGGITSGCVAAELVWRKP